MELASVFEVAAAVIASLGSGGLIVFGLSSWLGKVWATRITETLKADLAKSIEHTKVEMQEQSSQRLDAITRKREVYGAFVTSSRVLLAGGSKTGNDQSAFLEAYARSYLWASEAVVVAIRELVIALEQQALVRARGSSDPDLDDRAKTALLNCMLAMR